MNATQNMDALAYVQRLCELNAMISDRCISQESSQQRDHGMATSAAGLPGTLRQLLGSGCTNVHPSSMPQPCSTPEPTACASGATLASAESQQASENPGPPLPSYIKLDTSCHKGRLPKYVHSLLLQTPAPGRFTVHDLEWSFVEDGRHKALVAAIPEDRMHDFQAGEADRGKTRVHLYGQGQPTEGVLLQDRGTCMFERPRKPAQQKRRKLSASSDTNIVRYSKTQAGTSCKRGCVYCFYAKKYAKAPGVVILKFPCEDGDTSKTCRAMQHVTRDGTTAHTEQDMHHVRGYTDEVTQIVIQQLKLRVKPAVIIAGVQAHVRKKLGITAAMDQAEAEEIVQASEHAHDYLLDNSRICNLRTKHINSELRSNTSGTPSGAAVAASTAPPTVDSPAQPPPSQQPAPQPPPSQPPVPNHLVTQHTTLQQLSSPQLGVGVPAEPAPPQPLSSAVLSMAKEAAMRDLEEIFSTISAAPPHVQQTQLQVLQQNMQDMWKCLAALQSVACKQEAPALPPPPPGTRKRSSECLEVPGPLPTWAALSAATDVAAAQAAPASAASAGTLVHQQRVSPRGGGSNDTVQLPPVPGVPSNDALRTGQAATKPGEDVPQCIERTASAPWLHQAQCQAQTFTGAANTAFQLGLSPEPGQLQLQPIQQPTPEATTAAEQQACHGAQLYGQAQQAQGQCQTPLQEQVQAQLLQHILAARLHQQQPQQQPQQQQQPQSEPQPQEQQLQLWLQALLHHAQLQQQQQDARPFHQQTHPDLVLQQQQAALLQQLCNSHGRQADGSHQPQLNHVQTILQHSRQDAQ